MLQKKWLFFMMPLCVRAPPPPPQEHFSNHFLLHFFPFPIEFYIWVRFPRTGKMCKMWHSFFLNSTVLKRVVFPPTFLNCSEEIFLFESKNTFVLVLAIFNSAFFIVLTPNRRFFLSVSQSQA